MTAAPTLSRQALAAAALLAITVAACSPAMVRANTPEPTLSEALQDKQQMGSARLRVWGFEVYDASLWTRPGFEAQRYAEHRFALELHYLRAFKGPDIAQRSLDEMRGIGSIGEEQAARWLEAMRGLFPDVRRGDRITGVHLPGRGALFYLNGQPIGEVADAAFSVRFFGIWLSPETSQPGMRKTLLQQVGAAPRSGPAVRTP